MPTDVTLGHAGPAVTASVWEFDETDDLGTVTARVLDGREPPTWRAALIASHGDVVTLQVVEGAPSSADSVRFYIERRGPYRRLRIETWPGAVGARVLVTMRAWPQRGID